MPQPPDAVLARQLRAQRGDLAVGQPVPLGLAQQQLAVTLSGVGHLGPDGQDLGELVDEPGVDAGGLSHLVDA